MKAYIVTSDFDGTGGVIFADHAIAARRTGANEYADGEFADISCRRCPDLDGLEGDPRAVTFYLLDQGWWFDDGRITVEACPNVFVTREGEAYANPMEWLSEREGLAVREGRRRRAEREFWGQWPWADEIRVHVEPSLKVDVRIVLPFLEGVCRYLEREDAFLVERRDVAAFRRLYRVNRDAEVRAS